jgi:hypothetical protein
MGLFIIDICHIDYKFKDFEVCRYNQKKLETLIALRSAVLGSRHFPGPETSFTKPTRNYINVRIGIISWGGKRSLKSPHIICTS